METLKEAVDNLIQQMELLASQVKKLGEAQEELHRNLAVANEKLASILEDLSHRP